MRRVLFAMVVSAALLALGPSAALAHHRSHHARHHSRHARTHIRRFGRVANSNSPTTTSSNDTAGTVKMFTPGSTPGTGTLEILLNDGVTVVTGQVTADTQIECMGAENDNNMQDDIRSDNGPSGGSGDNGDQGDDNGMDNNDNNENDNANCSTNDLTTGAGVQEAELKLGSGGAVWDKVELQSTSTGTGGGGDD